MVPVLLFQEASCLSHCPDGPLCIPALGLVTLSPCSLSPPAQGPESPVPGWTWSTYSHPTGLGLGGWSWPGPWVVMYHLPLQLCEACRPANRTQIPAVPAGEMAACL